MDLLDLDLWLRVFKSEFTQLCYFKQRKIFKNVCCSPVRHALADPLPRGAALLAAAGGPAPRRRNVLPAGHAAGAPGPAGRGRTSSAPRAAATRAVSLRLLALAGQRVPEGSQGVLIWYR